MIVYGGYLNICIWCMNLNYRFDRSVVGKNYVKEFYCEWIYYNLFEEVCRWEKGNFFVWY